MTGDPSQRWDAEFVDLVHELAAHGVEFLIVGSHAMARHGYVRSTLDLDVLVRASPENAERTFTALAAFGAPLHAHGVTANDFANEGTVYQLGLPPTRIDILTGISGVSFDDAWASRVTMDVQGVEVAVIGRQALIRNKRASGRSKDIADVEELERSGDRGRSD